MYSFTADATLSADISFALELSIIKRYYIEIYIIHIFSVMKMTISKFQFQKDAHDSFFGVKDSVIFIDRFELQNYIILATRERGIFQYKYCS